MNDHTRDPTVEPPPAGTAPTGWDQASECWEHATLRRALVHGVRLFNDGAAHEAHDCFEAEWYSYANGTVESAFLHGLTQVAAGVHKRIDVEDDEGMRSLFQSAKRYLQPVPAEFYGLDVAAVCRMIEQGLAHPAAIDDWRLTLDGSRPVAGPADYEYVSTLE